MSSVFLVHIMADHCARTCANHSADYRPGATVLLIDYGACPCSYHPTNYGTLGCLAPTLFMCSLGG
jgi:hypothetical protein